MQSHRGTCTVTQIESISGLVDLHSIIKTRNVDKDMNDYVENLLAGDTYYSVWLITPLSLLRDVMSMEARLPDDFVDYVHTHVLKESGTVNHWENVVLPYMNTLVQYILYKNVIPLGVTRSVLEDDIRPCAVVVNAPFVPCLTGYSVDTPIRLHGFIAQCRAYGRTRLPNRGGECGRWGTRLVPEGFSFVLSHISGPGWRACELPSNGSKCVMVVVPKDRAVWFFKINGGSPLGSPALLGGTVDGTEEASVFECVCNCLTDNVTIYDCSISRGVDIRTETMTLRVASIENVVKGWLIGCSRRPVSIARYTPPSTLIGRTTATRVMFVNDSAPLITYSGSDAYVWKVPSLLDGQYVMVYRVGECMAVDCYGKCLMRKVGNVENHDGLSHMGVYVFERCIGDGMWFALRRAKNRERLFTHAECMAGEYPSTQITQSGMWRLVMQISPSDKMHGNNIIVPFGHLDKRGCAHNADGFKMLCGRRRNVNKK